MRKWVHRCAWLLALSAVGWGGHLLYTEFALVAIDQQQQIDADKVQLAAMSAEVKHDEAQLGDVSEERDALLDENSQLEKQCNAHH